jgi:putative ABC transport system ATP-binding protein
MAIIEAHGISKAYCSDAIGAAAMHPISLRIEKGEFVAVVGPSGSGKSTLLNIIGLLDRPSSGTLVLDGVFCAGLNGDQMARIRNRRIGFIFQAYHLLSRLTAIANVELPLVYAGVRKAERHARAERALDAVGILCKRDRLPAQLSGGEQQRVAVARAIVSEPAIVLADEPTGALDTTSGREVIEILKRLNRAGHTIVMVTHDHAIACEASRTLVMRDGWLVDDGNDKASATGPQPVLEAAS